MNFATIDFFVFLGLVYALYRVLPHRGQNVLLLLASYFFYGCWDWRFLSLIWLSTAVDYIVGHRMAREERVPIRRRLLIVSLVTNLGLLGVFKYFNFFADSMQTLLGTVGLDASWSTLNIVLPVGISFYTFQTLSYTIDIYKKKLEPVEGWLDFAVFVAFFPQLVAGPIERAAAFLPQVVKPRRIRFDQSARGAYLILFGLFKKVVIADGVAGSVDAVFNSTGHVSTIDVVLATYLFAAQIYCDFSGYSDIARGVAKLLGFELMVNFELPYFSVNPQEFWRRWHISLSTWLRDYLYISLGGNRGGEGRTYRNLILTMVLGGLWHGAAWNFVLWGAYQGGILAIHRVVAGARAATRRVQDIRSLLVRVGLTALFFQVVCYGWLLFRANSLQQVIDFTGKLSWAFDPTGLTIPKPPLAAMVGMLLLFVADGMQYLRDDHHWYLRWPKWLQGLFVATLMVVLMMGFANARQTFIYFQF